MKYKKTNLCPTLGFPVAKSSKETLAMDLKEYSHIKMKWFLYIIDLATRYSVSSITRTKKR